MYLLIMLPPVALLFYLFTKETELMDSFIQIVTVYKNISQGEYFLLLLISHSFLLIPQFVISFSPDLLLDQDALVLNYSYIFISLYITMTSGIRRLRDIDWNSFLILVPFVFIIILFIPSFSQEKKKIKNLEKKIQIAELKKKLKDLEDD